MKLPNDTGLVPIAIGTQAVSDGHRDFIVTHPASEPDGFASLHIALSYSLPLYVARLLGRLARVGVAIQ